MEGTGLKIEEIFLAFTLLLVLAKLLGEAIKRLGQPAILGEIAAGIIDQKIFTAIAFLEKQEH